MWVIMSGSCCLKARRTSVPSLSRVQGPGQGHSVNNNTSCGVFLRSFWGKIIMLPMVLAWAPRWSSTFLQDPFWWRLVPAGSCGSWHCWMGWGTYWMPSLSGCKVSEVWQESQILLMDSLGCHRRQRSIAGSWQDSKTRWGRRGLFLLLDSSGFCPVMVPLSVETSKQDGLLDVPLEFGLDLRLCWSRSLLCVRTGWRLVLLLEVEFGRQLYVCVMCCSSWSQLQELHVVWSVQWQWSWSIDLDSSEVTWQDYHSLLLGSRQNCTYNQFDVLVFGSNCGQKKRRLKGWKRSREWIQRTRWPQDRWMYRWCLGPSVPEFGEPRGPDLVLRRKMSQRTLGRTRQWGSCRLSYWPAGGLEVDYGSSGKVHHLCTSGFSSASSSHQLLVSTWGEQGQSEMAH